MFVSYLTILIDRVIPRIPELKWKGNVLYSLKTGVYNHWNWKTTRQMQKIFYWEREIF